MEGVEYQQNLYYCVEIGVDVQENIWVLSLGYDLDRLVGYFWEEV